MNFGNNLRNLRVQRGLTQHQLAAEMHMAQATIASYEVGRNEPTFQVIQKFADYFHVSPLSLLPFGDILMENETTIIAEQIQDNEKLMVLFDIVHIFSDADIDTLITVANSLKAKYGV